MRLVSIVIVRVVCSWTASQHNIGCGDTWIDDMLNRLLYEAHWKSSRRERNVHLGSRDGLAAQRWERSPSTDRCGPGSILTQRNMWVEFVVGSHPAPRVFLRRGFPVFLAPEQPHLKFQFNLEDPYENLLRLMWLPFWILSSIFL